MREEAVEVDLAEDGAEGGLGELRGLVDVVGDLNDGLGGIDDAEHDDGVDLERDIVAGDDVLRRNFHGLLTQRDADDLVYRPEDEDDSGTGGGLLDAAETEDHGTLVLLEDVDGADQIEDDDCYGEEKRDRHDVQSTSGRSDSCGQCDCKAATRGVRGG